MNYLLCRNLKKSSSCDGYECIFCDAPYKFTFCDYCDAKLIYITDDIISQNGHPKLSCHLYFCESCQRGIKLNLYNNIYYNYYKVEDSIEFLRNYNADHENLSLPFINPEHARLPEVRILLKLL